MLAQNSQKTPLGDFHDQISDSDQQPSNTDHQLSPDGDENSRSRKTGKWTPQEDDLLRKYVPLYGEKQWRKISEHVPGRSSIQCLHRWTKILKPGLVKGPWTTEEDQKLVTWVKTEGATKWAQCANYIKGRSGKQCRERWFNNLNPDVKKGNWSKEEDELIFQLYQKYGSSWSKVAKYLPGRTENAIKNRFYSTLRKLAADKKKGKNEMENELSAKEEEDGPIPVGANQLYMLLNDKTCEVVKKEGEEEKEEKNVKGEATQAFNINGEKILVARDSKVDEKNIQEVANRLITNDMEDNDIAFEDFLTTLDCNLKENFLIQEFETSKKAEDVSQFEDLQKKVLNFCQANIVHLSETFKTIETNKASTTASEGSHNQIKATPESKLQLRAQKPELNVQQDPLKTRGSTTILTLTPPPTHQKEVIRIQQFQERYGDSQGKGPLATGFSLYNSQGNKGSPKNISENSSEKLKEKQGKVQQKGNMETEETAAREDMHKKLVSSLGRQESKEGGVPQTEKRLTFLFQQLYALEDLLAKTKSDLVQFESSIRESGKKSSGHENVKTEEDSSEAMDNKGKGRMIGQIDSEFEQIAKKKRVV